MSHLNCINYCVSRILTDIDRTLLQKAFKPSGEWYAFDSKSLEQHIEEQVVRDYVMTDLNLVSGQSATIPIHDLPHQQLNNAHVFRIPLSMTQGRRITAVHSVEMGHMDTGMGYGGATAVASEAAMGPQKTGTARVLPGGPNVIAVYEWVLGTNTFLRCNLEHDENLQNINPAYQRTIAKLATLAAKHLCHVRLANAYGDGEANGGAASDFYRSTVDEYRDSKELYEEHLTIVKKQMLMNDRAQHNRIARLGFGRI